MEVYIKWIKDGNIKGFVEMIDTDPFSEGLSLGSYFNSNVERDFSIEYLIIDADMQDNHGEETKKDFLLGLIQKVENLENTHILISSPSIESFIDTDDIYNYNEERYKTKIGRIYPNGLGSLAKDEIIEALIMNFTKFSNEKIDYDEQRKYAIETYENDEIKIRNLLFHIIAEENFINCNEKIEEYIKNMT